MTPLALTDLVGMSTSSCAMALFIWGKFNFLIFFKRVVHTFFGN